PAVLYACGIDEYGWASVPGHSHAVVFHDISGRPSGTGYACGSCAGTIVGGIAGSSADPKIGTQCRKWRIQRTHYSSHRSLARFGEPDIRPAVAFLVKRPIRAGVRRAMA